MSAPEPIPRPARRTVLQEQYEDVPRQHAAARLGMWLFLGSESLLFAALFALYGAYRAMYPADFVRAASYNDATIGTINTLVLITSSLTVALAIHAARSGRPRRTGALLLATLGLGTTFLVLKGVEYADHFHHGIYPGVLYRFAELSGGGARSFFTLYYFLTMLHAAHVVGGMSFLAWLAAANHRRPFTDEHHLPLELGGLYWHLVDAIWIFLWPLLYLAR